MLCKYTNYITFCPFSACFSQFSLLLDPPRSSTTSGKLIKKNQSPRGFFKSPSMPYERTMQEPACPIRKVMPKKRTFFTLWGILEVYKRQGAAKVWVGWSFDDSKMHMDERKAWGIFFGWTFSFG